MTNVVAAGSLFAASTRDRMVAQSQQVVVRATTRSLHAEGKGLTSCDLDDLQQPRDLRAERLHNVHRYRASARICLLAEEPARARSPVCPCDLTVPALNGWAVFLDFSENSVFCTYF
ncbi:UNVERIFIED_CONTAM: hypothetical protein Sradi_0479100 [Sesamum radiatum]|uniref:Uncharacterized protein n=1 Tax=Sesamum radiatum TaxID=300843 RepID=A0AAW2W774_SESRA